MPTSIAAPTTRSASCAVGATPNVAVPRQIRDTFTPVAPRTEYFIRSPCLLWAVDGDASGARCSPALAFDVAFSRRFDAARGAYKRSGVGLLALDGRALATASCSARQGALTGTSLRSPSLPSARWRVFSTAHSGDYLS